MPSRLAVALTLPMPARCGGWRAIVLMDCAQPSPSLISPCLPSRDVRGGLHPRIESGADDQVAVGGPGEIADLVGDPIGEIARARPRLGKRRRSGALLAGGSRIGDTDKAGLDHVVEHLRRAARRLVAVA